MDSRNAVRVAKAISEPCQKHPVGFAKGKESKGDGGVYAKCVLKLSYPAVCSGNHTGKKLGKLPSRPGCT